MNEMQKQVNYNYTNDKNLCFETMAVQIKSEPDNISEDNLIHQRNQNSQETCSSLENSYMQISSEKIKVEPGLTNKEQDNIGLKLSTKASFMFSGSKNKTSNNSYTSEEGMDGHDSDYEVDSNDNLDSESELPQQHIQNSGMKGGLRGLRGQQTNVIMTRQRTADDNFPEEPNIDFINQSGGQKEHKELSLDKIFEEVRQNLINAGVAKETIPVPSSSTRVQKTVLQRKTAKAVAEFNRLQKSGTPSINSSEISEPVPSKKQSKKLQKTSIPNTISEDSPEVYTGEKRYSCNICGKGFYYKSHLRKHCGIHLGIKPYTCNICGKGFNQNSNMKTHMRTHADKKPFNCNLCDKGFNHNSSLQIHLRTHTGERPFVCKFCNKGFSRNNTLKIHEATHSEIKPYACTMCDKTFGRRYVLQRHVMTHTGEKPYTCSTCGRSFSQNGDLQKHIRTHTGERPFSCPICGRGFIQNGDMLKHKKTHKNDKGNKTHTHVCKCCQKVFKSNDDLEEHMKEHDDLKEHMKEHDNVDEHMKEHYDSVRFICTTCGDEFIDIEDFQRHKRIHDAELLHSIHKVRDSVQKEENAAMNTGLSPKALCGTSGKIPENFVKSGGKVITDQCLELFMNPRTDDTMEIVETGLKLDRIIAEVKQNLMSGLQFKKDKERHGVIESNDEKMDMNEKDIAYEQPIDIHGDDQNEAEASSEDDDDNSEENLLDSTNASQLVSSTVDLTQDESPRGTTCTGNKSEKPFICTECGNGYNQIGTLRNHMKKHSGERPHICETCGKDFRLHRDLNRHMKIHSSDKPFTCETCGKEFKWRWDLQKHTMIHTGEKPHICSICGKGFRQNCILQAHIRTHTGEKPYVCTTCGKGFCQSTDLQKHMRTHTGEKLYFCETCGKGFSLRYNLRKHMQMHDRNLSKLCTTVTEDL